MYKLFIIQVVLPRTQQGGCADKVPSAWHVRLAAPCSTYPSVQLYIAVSLMFIFPNIEELPLYIVGIEQTTQRQTVCDVRDANLFENKFEMYET